MEIPRYDYYWQYVRYWGEVDTDFPALREGDRTVTSGEFHRMVTRLTESLLGLGIKKGDRIVTILPTGIEFVITLVAGQSIGAVIVPMDLKFRPADLKRFLAHSEPKLIISLMAIKDFDIAGVLSGLGPDYESIKKATVGPGPFGLTFEELLTGKPGLDDEVERVRGSISPDEGALIVFSGGTTGVPKAALLSHTNSVYMSYIEVLLFNKWLGPHGSGGRIKSVAALPPSHVGGTVEFIGTGIVGGLELIMMDTWNPYAVLEMTQKEQVPWIGGVPTMYAIILSLPDLAKFDLSCVKLAILSGEKVNLELLTGIRDKIAPIVINGYGSTETGSEVTFTEPGDDFARIADGYVGNPIGGMQIKIIDEKGRELGPGEPGEIITKGPLSIQHYYNMPQEDKAGFTADGWCRTGDLGYLTADGGLYIKGRIKQIIRVGSYTVLPTEIEEVAIEYENVGLAAAIGVPDKIYGEVVWLFIAPVWGTKLNIEGLMGFLETKLAKFKVPKKIVIKDDIPITRIGKADRTRLRKEVLAAIEKGNGPA
jgi:acyl-CoA synthetase (AMP-forming)/AMP-acid ligase II